MGRMGLESMGDEVKRQGLTLETALAWHFQANCYPPIPSVFIPTAKRAIERVNAGDNSALVKMPKGITHKVWGAKVPAYVLVDSLHLGALCNEEEF